jgi:hypothetical protein
MNPYDIEQTPMHFNKKFVGIFAAIFVFLLIFGGAYLANKQDISEDTITETTTELTDVIAPETSDTIEDSHTTEDNIEVTLPELSAPPEATVTSPDVNSAPVETLPPKLPEKPINKDPVTQGKYLTLTESERLIFATLLRLECGGSSYETKMAVASVVVNRMNMWNYTLRQVVFAKNQFSPARLIDQETGKSHYNPPKDGIYKECWQVVDDICENGPSIPSYVFYFKSLTYKKDSNGNRIPVTYHSWATPYKKIGSMYFSYAEKYTSICKYCGERFTKTEIADHRAECSQKH